MADQAKKESSELRARSKANEGESGDLSPEELRATTGGHNSQAIDKLKAELPITVVTTGSHG